MGLLSCHNVSFTYDGKTVLSNINFEINPGDYLCILGENGAGKSTLIKGFLNLKKVATGRILTGDGLKTNEIGYLPQQTQVQKDFPASVNEIVISGRLNNCGMRPFYSKEDKKIANSNMEKLGIYGLRKSCYRELSGGQQQRVLLARALCATKKLLLLDEPITGLDPVMSVELYKLIKTLNEQDRITIIMVSHDVKGAVDYASHILHLGKEQLFFGLKDEYLRTNLGSQFLAGGETS